MRVASWTSASSGMAGSEETVLAFGMVENLPVRSAEINAPPYFPSNRERPTGGFSIKGRGAGAASPISNFVP